MTQQHVHDIAEALRATRGFAHKRDISDVVSALGRSLPGGHGALAQAVPIGGSYFGKGKFVGMDVDVTVRAEAK